MTSLQDRRHDYQLTCGGRHKAGYPKSTFDGLCDGLPSPRLNKGLARTFFRSFAPKAI
jgi:hypothetical protein